METSVMLSLKPLVFQDLESFDMGLQRNKGYGFALREPGQLMQYWGMLNGVKIWIEVDLLEPERPMFRVAFGEAPEYLYQINMDEALALIRKEVCDVG